MKKLNIKLIKQETNKSCNVASLRMVLDYFGISVTEEEIWKHSELINGINPLPQTAYAAIKLGLSPEIITYSAQVFSRTGEFVENLEKYPKIYSEAFIQSYKKYRNHGGKMLFRLPTIKDIQKSISDKKPVIISIRPSVLYDVPYFYMHSWVITGFDKDNFFVNDSGGQRRKIPYNSLLAAWYSNSPEMLILDKK